MLENNKSRLIELLKKLENDNEKIRNKISQLQDIDLENIDVIRELLIFALTNTRNSVLKSNIAQIIGELKIEKSTKILLEVLENKDENTLTRAQVASSLGEIGDDITANILYDKYYRRKKIWDLEKYELLKAVIKTEELNGRGITKYKQLKKKDMLPSDQIKEIDNIIKLRYGTLDVSTSTIIEDSKSENALLDKLQKKLVNEDPQIRGKARKEFEKLNIKNKKSFLPFIENSLIDYSQEDIRVDLVRTLGFIDKAGYDLILKIVLNKKEHLRVRCKGMEKLELLDMSKSVETIFRIMEDTSEIWQVRNCAKQILMRISKRYGYDKPQDFFSILKKDEIEVGDIDFSNESIKPLIYILCDKEDEEEAHSLHEKLRKAGTSPWFDKADVLPGENLHERKKETLSIADFCIICLSSKSIELSEDYKRELEIVLKIYEEKSHDKIWLIPIHLDNCEIPKIRISKTQLIELQWTDYNKENAILRILKAIKKEWDSIADIEEIKFNVSLRSSLDEKEQKVGEKYKKEIRQKEIKSVESIKEKERIHFDIGIITALSIERDAVNRIFKLYRETDIDKRVYFKGTILNEKKNYEYNLIHYFAGVGQTEAILDTNRLIELWNPKYVIMLGIAGGINKNDIKIGDVLIASEIVYYELKKLKENGKKEIRPTSHKTDRILLSNLKNFPSIAEDEIWINYIDKTAKYPEFYNILDLEENEQHKPKVHTGPILTGESIVKNPDFIQELLKHTPKAIGIEMESWGVIMAAHDNDKRPRMITIRGVSDLADKPDPNKWDKLHQYVANVAAAYLFAFLKHGSFIL